MTRAPPIERYTMNAYEEACTLQNTKYMSAGFCIRLRTYQVYFYRKSYENVNNLCRGHNSEIMIRQLSQL